MRTYSEALELVLMSARNARLSSNKQWRLEYRAEAAKLGDGKLPELGDPPLGLED